MVDCYVICLFILIYLLCLYYSVSDSNQVSDSVSDEMLITSYGGCVRSEISLSSSDVMMKRGDLGGGGGGRGEGGGEGSGDFICSHTSSSSSSPDDGSQSSSSSNKDSDEDSGGVGR